MTGALRNLILTGALGACCAIPAQAMGDGLPAEELSGILAGSGVTCPLFRLSDGEVISLTGDLPPAEIGPLRITGTWLNKSNCMQGRTFRVQAYRPDFQE